MLFVLEALPDARPPELSSDLDDSDSRLPGSGSGGGGVSSVRVRGVLEDLGRLGSGSSMLMDFFPCDTAPGTKDFLRSFFDMPGVGRAGSARSSSPDFLRRENILDCFLGTVLLKSPVGAVVMMSGGAV